MATNKNIISKGFTVVFINGDYTGFINTLAEATNLRDMVAGGGMIYYATLEKSGLNCFCVRGPVVRNSYGTPL